MGRPIRMPILFDDEKPIIYFLNLSASRRGPVLANVIVFDSMMRVVEGLDRWKLWAITVMPDHVHLLVSPPQKNISIGEFSRWLKIGLKREGHSIEWQQGCFDQLLRNPESGREKWL